MHQEWIVVYTSSLVEGMSTLLYIEVYIYYGIVSQSPYYIKYLVNNPKLKQAIKQKPIPV